ncbi:MAG TPA: LysM peptidoglycan-binding domain-containing protein [Opitutaceae bacterium]|nr:LysM peptidoglycan-binding domain-containing protein [Opitutaceae bacterium]
MKILKIFGIVVGIHVFALVLIFVNPGCSSSSKVTPVPSDTTSHADTPTAFNVPNAAPRPSASPSITFNPDAPAVAASGSSAGRMPPTRPGSPVAVTIVAEPVTDVTPAKTYTVVKGDSLWELAKKHHIAAPELAAANNLKLTTVLHPGQKLIIPGRPASPTAAATANPAASAGRTAETIPAVTKSSGNAMKHMVKSGETLGSIARQYGVKSNDIAVANSISDPAKVRAGQELIIPGWQPIGKSGKSGQKSDSAKQKASPPPTINVDAPSTTPPPANDVPVIRVDDNPFTPAPKGN